MNRLERLRTLLLGGLAGAAALVLAIVLIVSTTGAFDDEVRKLTVSLDEVQPDTYPFIVMGELTVEGQADWSAGLEAGTLLNASTFELDDDRRTITFSDDAGVEADAVEAVVLVREADTTRLIALENRGTHLSYPVDNETLDIGLYLHEVAFEVVDFSPVCPALVQEGDSEQREVAVGILANPSNRSQPVSIQYGEVGPASCPQLSFEAAYGGHWDLKGTRERS